MFCPLPFNKTIYFPWAVALTAHSFFCYNVIMKIMRFCRFLEEQKP